jgi:hypothetical protein
MHVHPASETDCGKDDGYEVTATKMKSDKEHGFGQTGASEIK